MKYRLIFTFFSLIIFTVSQAYGQEYDRNALRFFRSSVECLMKGNYTQAIEDSTRVLRIDPDSTVSYVIRARAYYELGDFERAIADSTAAIQRDRNNIGAYDIRANAHVKRGDTNRAIADWNAIIRIKPDAEDAALNLERARQQR
jgi:tetratricopeptide (TPR) repeat protein